MKLANRAYMVTLILLMLVFAASAQNNTDRSEKDDRNTAPTFGTGGPAGGPTGLFTVYDGQTLRKGEYTLSFAHSNYDRDPGNADIASSPISFQIGVTNKLELFFNTEAYRQIKVNAPQNLSSFYLPNSQLLINGNLRSGGAIVLAPGTTGATAIFRPVGAPFSQFPFSGPFFFPSITGTNNLQGPPRQGGGADLFPGVGSPFGSILPGIVLTTSNFTNAAGTVIFGTQPASFSVAPTYLADAPFINRRYGTSSFNSMDFGAKWRLNSLNSSWGHGLTAFYRWYLDNADGSGGGFNQLQRGAGPGSNWGDVGLTYFIDSRVQKWANVSANVGYVYTSKVKADFAGGERTLFDPGDQLQYAVAVDFPVNRHFQPILEFRGLKYVGGRTPNALEQDPIDGLAGVRIFPRRWLGLSLGYRYNFNQQDADSFEDDTTTQTVNVLCGPVTPPGCVPSTVTVTRTGAPIGLGVSNDPHGYFAQFFIGRRNKRAGEIVNQPANVESVTISDTVITLPCPPNTSSRSGACNDSKTVSVTTVARDPENDVLTYNYTVSGGRIVGTGANVQWDLTTAQAGTYTITTGVDDGCGVCGRTDTKTIRVEACPDCSEPVRACNCPTVTVSGPSGVTSPGSTMTFTANGGGDLTYNWSVSRGTIVSGQGTQSITVATTADDAGQNVTATVKFSGGDIGRADCTCGTEASETAGVQAPLGPNMTDEFGTAVDDDVKARVDNFYIQLNNNPGAQGYIINYGTPAEIRRRRAQITKAINFRKYDASRVTFVDGPDNGSGVNTKFYVVPAGAQPPTP
ncbi:MAG: hypothetical protein WKF34_11460 [Pyrinomonadaceae bacterium]